MKFPLYPAFRLTSLSLALFSVHAAADSSVNLPTVEVSGSRAGSSVFVTENNKAYTIEAMKSATGMALSDKETPQSTSVITRQYLDDKKTNTVTEAMAQTNGIFVQAIDRGRSTFYARGFPIDKYQIDGLNVTFDNQWISGENLDNMMIYDHIEVVRGANGLTTGEGNPAARVNFIRKHADSKTRRTVFNAGGGRWSSYEASADHTQPLTADGRVRGRFVIGRSGGKSFVDWEKSSQNVFYGVIDADIGDKTELSIGASRRENKQDSYMWGGLPLAFSDGTLADWPRNKNTSTGWSYWNSTNTDYFTNVKHRFNNNWNVELKANHSRNSGDSELLYMSGAIDKTTGSGYSLSPGKFQPLRKESNIQLTFGGKYSLFNRKHDLIFGGQFNRNYNDAVAFRPDTMTSRESFYTWSGTIPAPHWNDSYKPYRSTAHDRGLFAATRIRAHERVGVIAGIRLSNHKRERSFYGTDSSYRSGNVWLPYGGITVDLNNNHTVYASYTDSFKTQHQLDAKGRNLDPTRGRNMEIGLKSSYLDNRLQSQISLFQIKQNNVAQRDGNKTVSGMPPGTAAYYNAKGVRTRGYELELTGRIAPQWNISAGFMSARGKDASGNQINTNVPLRQLKLYTTYDLGGRLAGLTVGGGVSWQSGRYYNAVAPLTGRIEEKSRALADLMIRYQVNKQLSAQINADNLFDKKYFNEFSFNQVNYGTPRNIRASVRYEF